MASELDNMKRVMAYMELLEKENDGLKQQIEELKAKLEKYETMNLGRPKHDARWQACYDLFVEMYEAGNKIPVIVEKTGISRRTIYRYKEYYDSLKKTE